MLNMLVQRMQTMPLTQVYSRVFHRSFVSIFDCFSASGCVFVRVKGILRMRILLFWLGAALGDGLVFTALYAWVEEGARSSASSREHRSPWTQRTPAGSLGPLESAQLLLELSSLGLFLLSS